MSLYDYKGATNEAELVDMWGQQINVGDTLLYPYRYGSSSGAIQVVEVTGIRAATESKQTADWTKEAGYRYYTATRTVLHVMARTAGSKGKSEWLRYPERAVNITGSDMMQFVDTEESANASS